MPKESRPKGRPVTPPGGDNLLARFRSEHGLSQREAAAILGISQNRLSELERAEKIPPAVARLASLLMALEADLGKDKTQALLLRAEQILANFAPRALAPLE